MAYLTQWRSALLGLLLVFGINSTFAVTPLGQYQQPQAKQSTTRTYQYSIKGKPVGSFTIHKEYYSDHSVPYLFTYHLTMQHKRKRIDLDMEVSCQDDEYYSPVSILSKGIGPEVFSFSANFSSAASGGIFHINGIEEKIYLDVPDRLVGALSLFELVQQLPFDKANIFKYNKLDEIEMTVFKGFTIQYLGEDNNIYAGYKNLHHFKDSGEGRSTAHYWLNDDHQLMRVLWDNKKEFLLQ